MSEEKTKVEVKVTSKSKKKLILPVCIGGVLLIAVLVVILIHMNKNAYRTAIVNDYKGDVELERANGKTFDVEEDMRLIPEDEVEVGEASNLDILVDDDKHIAVLENSKIVIETEGNPDAGLVSINLKYGHTIVDIENKLSDDDAFMIKTPNATVSVRGTTFEVEYDKALRQTHVKVIEGKVKVWTNVEETTLGAGEEVYVIDEEIVTSEQAGTVVGNPQVADNEVVSDAGSDGTEAVSNEAPTGKNWYNFEKANENSIAGGKWSHDMTLIDTFFESFRVALVDTGILAQTDVATIDEIVSLGEISISSLDTYPWKGSGQGIDKYDSTTFCGDMKSIMFVDTFAEYEGMLMAPEGDGHIYISEIVVDDQYNLVHMIVKLGGTDAYLEYNR